MSDMYARKLKPFQNRALKKLFPCPKSTALALVRILTGTMPIADRIDILKILLKTKAGKKRQHSKLCLVQARKFS